MNIPEIVWERVSVICESDPAKNEHLHQSSVYLSDRKHLTIKSASGSQTYIEAQLVSLTPSVAIFNACWFTCSLVGNESMKTVPVEVYCHF